MLCKSGRSHESGEADSQDLPQPNPATAGIYSALPWTRTTCEKQANFALDKKIEPIIIRVKRVGDDVVLFFLPVLC